MKRYVLARLAWTLVATWLVLTLTFGLLVAAPDPGASAYVAGQVQEGADYEEARESYERARGRDAPVLERYRNYLVGVATLDWGWSESRSQPVIEAIATAWPYSVMYAAPALLVSTVLGVAIGFVTGMLTLLVLIVLGIPALLITVPTILAVGVTPIAGTILLVTWLLAGVLFFVATLVITVPFKTFQRYYALLVLGDIDADLDVVPTTRAAVRADGGTDGEDGDTGAGDDGDGFDDDSPDGNGDSTESAGGDDGEDSDDGWNVDR